MTRTPPPPQHLTSTTASDRPGSNQDQPRIDATMRPPAADERALVLGGGGSTGNAWFIGVVAGLFDAGLDVTDADVLIGTSAGSTAAAQITSAPPTELFAAILAAAPPRRTGPVRPDGGPSWSTQWRATVAARRPSLQNRRQPVHRRRVPVRRECRPGSRIRAGARAVTTGRRIAASPGVGHPSGCAGRPTAGRRQQSRNGLPGSRLRAPVRRPCDGSVAASARSAGRLRPRQSARRTVHRILVLTLDSADSSHGSAADHVRRCAAGPLPREVSTPVRVASWNGRESVCRSSRKSAIPG